LVNQAQELLTQAGNVDEATAQLLALQADDLLTRAEPLATDPAAHETIGSLRLQAQQLMDRAGTITRPPAVTLATFAENGDPAMLVYGGELFLIERSRSSVYRLEVNPQATVAVPAVDPLFTAGVPLPNGPAVGTPRFLAWLPAGGGRTHNGLVLLTEEGELFDFEVETLAIRQLTFSGINSEDLPAMSGYEGNLYLLDRQNRQIWKYVPDETGQYSAAPEGWMKEPGQQAMGAPVDMAIDGFIFLLDESGQVTRFQVGEPRPGFALDPVTPALTEPVAIAKAPPESTDLFVADPQRVLRFDQNGRFRAEYRAPLGSDWGPIRDIAADPNSESFFVLTSNGLHMLDIRETGITP
jgi:hypothetical protein